MSGGDRIFGLDGLFPVDSRQETTHQSNLGALKRCVAVGK
jgi:hypothetical protein